MRAIGAAGALALLACAAVSAGERPPRYAVAPVRSGWADARIVGKRHSGAICASAGSIAWRDVAPDPTRTADRIADALKAAGMDVASGDAADEAGTRIVATIDALAITACAPHFGIVRIMGGQMLKGEGQVTITWTLREKGRDAAPGQAIASHFAFRGTGLTPRDALLDGIAANATLFAQAQHAKTAPPASIR